LFINKKFDIFAERKNDKFMVATISADIVRSTSLSTQDMMMLRSKLIGLFGEFEKEYPGFWARIVRGDGIECFVPEYRFALRIAILIKLFVKVQAAGFDSHELLQRHGIRFSIGIADINYADKSDDIINGTAINISGRNLDRICRKDYLYSVFEMDRGSRSLSNLLDSYVALAGNLVDSYSAKQAEVVFYKLLGLKEVEIAERLGVYQSAVNTRSSGAQWRLLNMAIRDFEELDF
jgi:hypothetical protein